MHWHSPGEYQAVRYQEASQPASKLPSFLRWRSLIIAVGEARSWIWDEMRKEPQLRGLVHSLFRPSPGRGRGGILSLRLFGHDNLLITDDLSWFSLYPKGGQLSTREPMFSSWYLLWFISSPHPWYTGQSSHWNPFLHWFTPTPSGPRPAHCHFSQISQKQRLLWSFMATEVKARAHLLLSEEWWVMVIDVAEGVTMFLKTEAEDPFSPE